MEKTDGIRLEREKIYELAYADDIIMIVEGEISTNRMMYVLEEYICEKGLEVNVKKTKISLFPWSIWEERHTCYFKNLGTLEELLKTPESF